MFSPFEIVEAQNVSGWISRSTFLIKVHAQKFYGSNNA